jgi:dipeptidyl aminopeptidase/acylaminoacyl peptidase
MIARLRELKKAPVEIMVIPDEVHSFLLHENWVEVFKKSAGFFDRYLRPKK